ncbi:hypothetical protein VaNZ11_003131 [Volvox africanus]|uniref:von Hippel-Lindau disease tumour suppressor beta domain-containing protein n=1 Tax=Volvox africanus TaxID=51714 RepID=A0ABQ5RTG5_9CHLO|nr:hypothetical protein VaNZ11_003131 [Volvox africanus]
MGPAAEEAETGSVNTTAPAGQLNAAAAVGATLTKDVHQMEWNGQVSENMFHLCVNSTAEPLELSWGDELRDNPHSTVAPHDTAYLGTYSFHTWRIRSKSRGLIAAYTGPSVILTVTEDDCTTELNPSGRRPHQLRTTGPASTAAANGSTAPRTATDPEMTSASAGGGQTSEPGYRQRSTVLEMPIWAFDCVSEAAVARLAHIVRDMLAHSPAPLLQRLVEGGASFAVFGTDQVVTDVPAHRFMRYNTGRNLDTSARGLGATPAVPVTSCGEENLTMQGDRWYPCQSILIHEVGHMVHNMGLPSGPEGVEGVLEAYRAAMKARLYPKGCYMMTNEQEYWAVAVESWFESTIRGDVNGGIKTRAQLRKHDPRLAALLEAAFGDGEWRYWKDCPRQLSMPTRAQAAATVAAAMKPQRRPSATVAPSPPSWRARRPAKLAVDSMLDNAESSSAVRLLLRRLLCRRFLAIRRRRGNTPHTRGAVPVAAMAANTAELVDGAAVTAAAAVATATHAYKINHQRDHALQLEGNGTATSTGASAVPWHPPLPKPMAVEMPPPLPAAVRGSQTPGLAVKKPHRQKRKEKEESEYDGEDHEEDSEELGDWPGEVEMPPPLPEPLQEPLSLPPLSAAAAITIGATSGPASSR